MTWMPPLDRGDAVAAAGEVPVLAAGGGEPADQLGAQLARLDDRVDHQLAGQPDDVDVPLVLRALRGDERRPLGLVGRSPRSCWRRRR